MLCTALILHVPQVRRTEVALSFESEEEQRVHLMVHDLQPPFLDGRVTFTRQSEAVSVRLVE